jgi:hypothetical protein
MTRIGTITTAATTASTIHTVRTRGRLAGSGSGNANLLRHRIVG